MVTAGIETVGAGEEGSAGVEEGMESSAWTTMSGITGAIGATTNTKIATAARDERAIFFRSTILLKDEIRTTDILLGYYSVL